eukprot:gene24266-29472_t
MSNVVVALCTEIKKVAEMASLGDGVKASLLQPKSLALKNDLKSRGTQSFAVQLLDAVLQGANFEIAEEGETQADFELPERASAFLEDLGSVVKDLKKEFVEGPTETFMLQFKTALEGSAGKENNKRLAQFEMKERAKSKAWEQYDGIGGDDDRSTYKEYVTWILSLDERYAWVDVYDFDTELVPLAYYGVALTMHRDYMQAVEDVGAS